MPGIVLSAMVNPFKRLPRYEYVYGPTGYEALDPIAPLLDDMVHDNIGVVVVGDQYSVWPETGIFPKATSYDEVLEKLRNLLKRRCGARLSPRLCKRLEYVIAPWSQLVGGWRFTGAPSDAEAFVIHDALGIMRSSGRRISRVTVVLDPDADTGLSHVVLLVAKNLAALTGSLLSVLVSEPRPYPAAQKTQVTLQEIERINPRGIIGEVVGIATSSESFGETLLGPRTPLGARKYSYNGSEAEDLTIITLRALAKRYYVLLPYQACGARDPLDKLHTILGNATRLYIEATQLSKKRVGGTIVHHLGFNPLRLRALVAGTIIEARVLEIVLRHQACETLYDKGVDRRVIAETEKLFGGSDETPRDYLEENNNYTRLRRVNEVRRLLTA